MSSLTFHIRSRFLGMYTDVTVLLPSPGRGTDPESFYSSGKKYKVFWLLHGGTGDHTEWHYKSLFELYAEENELIAVCPSAYNSTYADWPNFGGGLMMTQYFFHELMPLIYHWLPASEKREDNYIMGLSMGGQGAIKYALMHPEKFAGCGMLSSRAEEFPAYFEQQKGPYTPTSNLVRARGGVEAFTGSQDDIRAMIHRYVADGRQDEVPEIYHAIGREDAHFEQYLQFKQFCMEEGFRRISFHEKEGYHHEWRFWDLAARDVLRHFGFDCRG